MNEIISNLSGVQQIVIAIFVALFFIQLYYWVGYKLVAKHRHHSRTDDPNKLPPVSVIVIIEDQIDYIYEGLPQLLAQDHPNFEVVVVNDCGGSEITEALASLAQGHSNLRYTVIKRDDKFKHSRKFALLMGIKAARFERLVFTHCNCNPSSTRWLRFMAKGFVGSQVVIGYSALEREKGMTNGIIRSSHLTNAIRYLKSATEDRTYRGTMYNLGYTKSLFFANKGFTHLRLVLGEDDLLIQKIANRDNTAVIINPFATTITKAPSTMREARAQEKFYGYSSRFYPSHVKFHSFFELLTRALFFVSFLTIATLSVLDIIATGFSMEIASISGWGVLSATVLVALLRELSMSSAIKLISKRLGEKKILGWMLLYDKIAPLSKAWISISRRLKPPHGVWQQ